MLSRFQRSTQNYRYIPANQWPNYCYIPANQCSNSFTKVKVVENKVAVPISQVSPSVLKSLDSQKVLPSDADLKGISLRFQICEKAKIEYFGAFLETEVKEGSLSYLHITGSRDENDIMSFHARTFKASVKLPALSTPVIKTRTVKTVKRTRILGIRVDKRTKWHNENYTVHVPRGLNNQEIEIVKGHLTSSVKKKASEFSVSVA
mmetsp:Transcript_16801/g.41351  ORF Transcript_16801/g.41351 Transcript_16801/m.41351 type:complete len:205 (+) Transcript_16801:62-676(+)